MMPPTICSCWIRPREPGFVVKRNLRKEDRSQWLALAKQQTGESEYEKIDIGTRAWYGERELPLPGQPETILRVVFGPSNALLPPTDRCWWNPRLPSKPTGPLWTGHRSRFSFFISSAVPASSIT